MARRAEKAVPWAVAGPWLGARAVPGGMACASLNIAQHLARLSKTLSRLWRPQRPGG